MSRQYIGLPGFRQFRYHEIMRPSGMSVEIEYLRDYLQDEFRSTPEVKVQVVLPSGTRRSVDLPQDYDPEGSDLHTRRGVRVRVGSREYFFPAAWVQESRMDQVRRQVEEIREILGDA